MQPCGWTMVLAAITAACVATGMISSSRTHRTTTTTRSFVASLSRQLLPQLAVLVRGSFFSSGQVRAFTASSAASSFGVVRRRQSQLDYPTQLFCRYNSKHYINLVPATTRFLSSSASTSSWLRRQVAVYKRSTTERGVALDDDDDDNETNNGIDDIIIEEDDDDYDDDTIYDSDDSEYDSDDDNARDNDNDSDSDTDNDSTSDSEENTTATAADDSAVMVDAADKTTKKTIAAKRQALKDELKQYRIQQSQPLGKPAYTVFTNKSLEGICAVLPTTADALLTVNGIGPKKLETYGDDILERVQRFFATEDELLSAQADELNHHRASSATIARPEPISIESLTDEQRQVVEIALQSSRDDNDTTTTTTTNNVFISGAAGTGKSHVSKYIIQTLQQVGSTRKVAATAPTGVAAINVGGSTLHSFFGIGLGTGSMSSLVKKVAKNEGAMKRIDDTDVLVIDEVSMVSSDLLETLDTVTRHVRKQGTVSDLPFGGIQIICVGDFFQLPPIFQMPNQGYVSQDERDHLRPFCFDSPVWHRLGLVQNTFVLQTVQRQESGSKFEQFLQMVRVGTVTADIVQQFNEKCMINNETHPLPTDGIVPTRLYTHNKNVDIENESRLRELPDEPVIFKAVDEWKERMPPNTLASIKTNMKVLIAAELPDEIQLKIGAQVMLTRNKDLDSHGVRGLVNGSRGVVERFDKDEMDNPVPVVRFDNGRVENIAQVEAFRFNPEGGGGSSSSSGSLGGDGGGAAAVKAALSGAGCLSRKQIPLKLAWAVTVHKSQGSTLTRAILDISSTFEPGQAYVSLSRVKSMDGLWLEQPVQMKNIMVSQRVLDYYRSNNNLR